MTTHFGERVRAARLERDWNQATLATRLGVAQSTVSRIEGGDAESVSDELIERLTKVLGLTASDYLSLRPAVPDGERSFWCRCCNAACESNSVSLGEDDTLEVDWRSDEPHPLELFGALNYCGFCGEPLAKQCPNPDCGRVRSHKAHNFCTACGTPFWSPIRPELVRDLKSSLIAKRRSRMGGYAGGPPNDDIPF